MTKFKYSYAITLDLAFPTINAPIDFGTGITNKQIHKAEDNFNARFIGRKELGIYQVEDRSISMVLSTSYEPDNVTREVSAFSQILVREYGFDYYSAKPGRLFNARSQSLPEEREPSKELDAENEANAERHAKEVCASTADYKEYEEYLAAERLEQIRTRPSKRKLNTFMTMSNEILGTDSVDRLDTYIEQLEDLTMLAKTKKNIMIRSKK